MSDKIFVTATTRGDGSTGLYRLMFSKEATRLISDYKYFSFAKSNDYIILKPVGYKDHSWKIIYSQGRAVVDVPRIVTDPYITFGRHKLYKCKEGFAFRRYEGEDNARPDDN